MGIIEAKKYINDLRKKQGDPSLWPDFLTGLPDKTTTIRKVNEAYTKLDRYAVSYIRIANVQPYVIKYGSARHMEIIQWAVAILKTTIDKYKGFMGVFDTHDFVTICKKKDLKGFIEESAQLFNRKIKGFYNDEDVRKKSVISFIKDDRQISMGLMELLSVTTGDMTEAVTQDRLIPHLGRLVTELEKRSSLLAGKSSR
jgi:GGDEF domain-containing protein